jgi:hypothetical protein
MTDGPWRFEPFPPTTFPVGESPFRVRGLAYVSMLEYLEKKTPRGLAQFESMLEGDPFLPYYRQIFVPFGDYDATPLLRMFLTAAAYEGVSAARFIEDRARGSARSDSQGLWKPLLSAKSLAQLVERLPVAFNRYFEPCHARTLEIRANGFLGVLSGIPSSMNGLYVYSTRGFVSACLESAGARNVELSWEAPVAEPSRGDAPLESIRFAAEWSD